MKLYVHGNTTHIYTYRMKKQFVVSAYSCEFEVNEKNKWNKINVRPENDGGDKIK